MTMARAVDRPSFPSLALPASGEFHHSLPMPRAFKPKHAGRAKIYFARSEILPHAGRILRTGPLLSLLPGSVRPVFPAPGNFSPARASETTLSGGSFVSRGNMGYSPHPIWGFYPLS